MIEDKINTTVNIGNIKLKNPIMPASGAFGEGMDRLIDFNQLDDLITKSITKYPQRGNVNPRACETQAGMINSIGIQSKGIEYYIQNTIPYYSQYNVPLISSISADSIEEFIEMSELISTFTEVEALELNISCPNLKNNGEAFGMNKKVTYELVNKIRQITNKPLLVKLTPNVTNIQSIAKAAESAGADALVVANTPLAMAIDIHSRKPKVGNIMGGLSGPAIKPIIIRQIYQVYEVSSLPIIGSGGVINAEDAIEMIIAGASAVQVGTANFVSPTTMVNIIQNIKHYMEHHQIKHLKELIGSVEISKQWQKDYI